jgi:predicted benzoate:H+ symporter BenE
MLKNWLGVLEAAVLFGGLAGLVTGMYLLATSPLPGVVLMLASMAMLVSSVKMLGEALEEGHESDAGR